MARKDLSNIGKNIVANRNRPTSMDELLDGSQTPYIEKKESQNYENTKIQNNKMEKNSNFERYETRLSNELDIRFRRYMFENKTKTNPTIIAALEEFLNKKGY